MILTRNLLYGRRFHKYTHVLFKITDYIAFVEVINSTNT